MKQGKIIFTSKHEYYTVGDIISIDLDNDTIAIFELIKFDKK